MKIIAMIPARLGSTRIPKKNLRILNGKPLIQHAIDLAKESEVFEEIWVNSESEDIGEIARLSNVNFHKRPKELADNNATNEHFTEEFLKKHDCDYVVMVNTTSPLLSIQTIKGFVEFVNEGKYDTIFSVVDEKTEVFYKSQPINFNFDKKINSQFLEPVKKVAWALTAWKKETFLKNCLEGKSGVFAGNCGTYSIPKDESVDLDTPEDWRIAEGMFEARKKSNKAEYWSL